MTIVVERLINKHLSVEEATKVLHALAVCPQDGSELVVMQSTDFSGKVIKTKISCLEGHNFHLGAVALALIIEDNQSS